MKPRFSLKLLLALATCVALFFGWRENATRVAREFHTAVTQGDESAADKLVRSTDDLLAGLRQIDRWLIRSIEIDQFERAAGTSGWLLNHQLARMKLHILDQEAGYGVVTVQVTATPRGIYHQQDGSWESETPPLLEWLLN